VIGFATNTMNSPEPYPYVRLYVMSNLTMQSAVPTVSLLFAVIAVFTRGKARAGRSLIRSPCDAFPFFAEAACFPCAPHPSITRHARHQVPRRGNAIDFVCPFFGATLVKLAIPST